MRAAIAAAAVLVVALTGCATTPTPSAHPDTDYARTVTAEGLAADKVAPSREFAHAACDMLDDVDADLVVAVARDTGTAGGLTVTDVDAILTAGIPAYCPQHTDALEEIR